MKIVFEDGDGKFLEQAIFRGLDRVLRGLARDNLFQAAGKPAEQVSIAEEESRVDREWLITETRSGPRGAERDERRVTARSMVEAVKEARKSRGWGGRVTYVSEVAKPLFGHEEPEKPIQQPASPPLPPGLRPAQQPPAAAPPAAPPPVLQEKKRTPRTNLAEILQSVGKRPEGYIPRDEAVKLIGGTDSDNAMLSIWIIGREVPAAIVCGSGIKPTKGLPGRVMLHKASLLHRDAHRKVNAGLPVKDRTKYQPLNGASAPPRLNGTTPRHDEPAHATA